jgi:hypothetical protein
VVNRSSQQATVSAEMATRLAWSLCAASVVGICSLVLLNILNGVAGLATWPQLGATLTFSAVGALVAARQPRNAVGWLLLAVGLCLTVSFVSESYARYVLVTAPGSLPGGRYAPFLFLPYFGAVAILGCFLPLYFPTGRLLSPRWRPVLWSGAAFLVLAVVGNGLQPQAEPLPGLRPVHNPILYLPAAKPLLDRLLGLAGPCALVALGGAVAALVVRFRRARGIERQQLKWFTYAAALTPLPFVVYEVDPSVFQLLFTLALPLVPISVGMAILRYRLYDIDRLINRTLVYGLLTALLAGVYAGLVLVLGQLFGGIGGDPPSWAVAGATLAVAALFQPARRRIQQVVDRRFNRRKYDATRTVEAFSARLRDEVDLDVLAAELLGVANQTMQPTTVSLWLRPAPQAPLRGQWRAS